MKQQRAATPPPALPGSTGLALLAHGFRPFFLLVGIWAPLGVALWVAALAGLAVPDGPLPLQRWHGHEMLAGFVAAAVIGFLLTAVPNWTGRRDYAGAPLLALLVVFLAGRLVLLPGSPLPIGAAAPIALAGLPATLLLLLPALIKAGKLRLAGPPLLVLGFWTGDVLMLGEAAGWWAGETWRIGQLLMANMAMMLVGVIGGRIIPSFTLNVLRRTDRPAAPQPLPGVDRAAILGLLAVVVVDLAAPDGMVAGGVAAVAALMVALRLSRWHGFRTLGQPILWVLHLAYGFVPLTLATKAVALLAEAPWAQHWLHLQGAGALALMILAVSTRATLGHTGRDLVASPATVAAYVLVALAAVVRVFGPGVTSDPLVPLVVAASFWTLGFGLFLLAYGPILLRPRADGIPG
ncbi:NnrS family protein [Falsiroseomonas sp. E2-1-a20]|uniref:NnrS family protein n=1 Tax=Falsiroseomonas sp. E2-1-a20 TaxID=3239300 RepID=UPI003F30F8B8